MKIKISYHLSSLVSLMFVLFSTTTLALDVNITKDISYITVVQNGKTIRISRIQDQSNHLKGGFTKTSRKCPPFCIQPMHVAPGVTTYGELEVINFITDYVKTNKGLLIDARTPSWHAKGTIPGSINMPFTLFSLNHNDHKLISTMRVLGVVRRKSIQTGYWAEFKDVMGIEKKPNSLWDFSAAKDLLLWCNGMWCGQSPRAIQSLLKLGYPASKLNYYRAGMQGWQILGLSVIK